MASLVLADHDGTSLKPSSLSAVSAARMLEGGGTVDVLVLGDGVRAVAEAASRVEGVARVRLAEDARLAHPLAEATAPALAALALEYDSIVAPVGSFAKNLLPRTAALLEVQPITEVLEILSPDTFVRPLYAGNAYARVRSHDVRRLITIRAPSFSPAAEEGGAGVVELLTSFVLGETDSAWEADEVSKSERPELTSAKTVISGGRGMQSGENFALLEKVADHLNAAVGASRAAVDAGYVSNEYQVGQTGKVVAPDLYIAVGISGAIQHLAGMKDSKVIVAINSDGEAPIFQVADYGLVADLFEAMPELERILREAKADV